MRKKVKEVTCNLTSWADVDQALAVIGDNQRTIESIESAMQEAMDNEKQAAEMKARPYLDTIAKLENQIRLFAEANRAELGDKKTKALNFGSVGFRKSTKVVLPKAAAKLVEIIEALKEKGMRECVKEVAPKIDKEALKKYPVEEIIAVGGAVKVEDVFWYTPRRAQIAKE